MGVLNYSLVNLINDYEIQTPKKMLMLNKYQKISGLRKKNSSKYFVLAHNASEADKRLMSSISFSSNTGWYESLS